jgi:hypothetical protein
MSKLIPLRGDRTAFEVSTAVQPQRVIVDKNGASARANGGIYSVQSFQAEQEQALIVYGSGDEEPVQREAAESLQRQVRDRFSNYSIPIKSDKEVTADELKSCHLVLIGRPDSNSLVQRFRADLPVTFGSRSFVVRGKTYAHPGSAVVAAATNPLAKRYSVVVIAGLSTEATLHAPAGMLRQAAGEVVVLPNRGQGQALVLPARELVRELNVQK